MPWDLWIRALRSLGAEGSHGSPMDARRVSMDPRRAPRRASGKRSAVVPPQPGRELAGCAIFNTQAALCVVFWLFWLSIALLFFVQAVRRQSKWKCDNGLPLRGPNRMAQAGMPFVDNV